MKINSVAFIDRASIPLSHTCEGSNISPALNWKDVPKKAKSLVLIVDDPDAPIGIWIHWIVYNIPVDAKGLPPGVPTLENLPHGMQQGKNSFNKIGYGGPCPPPGHGAHHYFFRLYALDTVLDIRSGVDRRELGYAMKGHILDQAELAGCFERQTVGNRERSL